MKDENGGPFSLIKYQAEIQISENIEEYRKAKQNQKVLDSKPSPEDVLNGMIQPREWHDSDTLKWYMQYVSHSNASRDDVMKLKQLLDQAMEYRQARHEGICPIREELMAQTFNEIIRQATINCPERGLLLMRVRDEHKMSLAAYQTLYESSVKFGQRKQLEGEEGMEELEQLVKELESQRDQLANKKTELISKKDSLEKNIMERKNIEIERRGDEKKLIDLQAEELKKFLQGLKNLEA